MNIYQALKCLADETASQEQVEESRAAVRKFLDDHAEDLATDPDRPATDTYPLAISLLAEDGICVMPFCHAADLRQALTQQSFGDLGRKLPNATIIQKVFDVVKAKGGKLPLSVRKVARRDHLGRGQELGARRGERMAGASRKQDTHRRKTKAGS